MRSSPRNTSKGSEVSVHVILLQLTLIGIMSGLEKNATGIKSTITSSSFIMAEEAATTSGKK